MKSAKKARAGRKGAAMKFAGEKGLGAATAQAKVNAKSSKKRDKKGY